MKHFRGASQGNPSAAGWVFELRMDKLLRQWGAIKPSPLGRGKSESERFGIYGSCAVSCNEGSPKILRLAVSQEHRLAERTSSSLPVLVRPSSEPSLVPLAREK